MNQTMYSSVTRTAWSSYPMGKREQLNEMGVHANYCAKAHDHSKDCDCHLQGNYKKEKK